MNEITNLINKFSKEEQQSIQQYYKIEIMKKLKSRIIIAGLVKDCISIRKQRENGESFVIGTIFLADGIKISIFDPNVDLQTLKGDEHFFEIKGGREYNGVISYTASEVLDITKVQELLGVSNGKSQTSEMPIIPKPIPVLVNTPNDSKEVAQEHSQEAIRKPKLPLIGKI